MPGLIDQLKDQVLRQAEAERRSFDWIAAQWGCSIATARREAARRGYQPVHTIYSPPATDEVAATIGR